MPIPEVITVKCRYCGQQLTLNEDSLAARETGTDPHQQLRQHLGSHSNVLQLSVQHCYFLSWLIDGLAFLPVIGSDRWRKHLVELVDYYQSETFPTPQTCEHATNPLFSGRAHDAN